jgi:predicted  nucleic acid-binding Zn-ribbon protein
MEHSVAKKLEALSKLQKIDIDLDELIKIRGALPEEVMDLEDEITGYQTRVEKQNQDLADVESLIDNNKTAIKDAERFIKKYEEQQMNVRNNREYDAITKEMELQHLEIQILEKKIKEAYGKIELKNTEIEETKHRLEEREKDLVTKKKELSTITAESEEDEKKISEVKGISG